MVGPDGEKSHRFLHSRWPFVASVFRFRSRPPAGLVA